MKTQFCLQSPVGFFFVSLMRSAFATRIRLFTILSFGVIAMLAGSGESLARAKFFGTTWDGWTSVDQVPASLTEFFDQVTPGWVGKWKAAEPTQGNFNWAPLDAMYQWGDINNAVIKEHAFMWHQSTPDWASSITDAGQFKQAVTTWITEYLKRYGSKTDFIDVGNEMYSNPPDWRWHLGGDEGAAWIIWLYQTTRDLADIYAPQAKLLVNDYTIL
jgi:GH35 family endo-1,4-beta-xylanase